MKIQMTTLTILPLMTLKCKKKLKNRTLLKSKNYMLILS